VAFVAVEFLRSRLTPSATWGSIAYTQYCALSLMQLLSTPVENLTVPPIENLTGRRGDEPQFVATS
jgi:hypothetical protein